MDGRQIHKIDTGTGWYTYIRKIRCTSLNPILEKTGGKERPPDPPSSALSYHAAQQPTHPHSLPHTHSTDNNKINMSSSPTIIKTTNKEKTLRRRGLRGRMERVRSVGRSIALDRAPQRRLLPFLQGRKGMEEPKRAQLRGHADRP